MANFVIAIESEQKKAKNVTVDIFLHVVDSISKAS